MAIKRRVPYRSVDPRFAMPGQESPLHYGRKGYEQGEGVPVQPGTFDRNQIDPDAEEEEFPRKRGRNFPSGHIRSDEDLISDRRRVRNLARHL